MRKYIFLFIVFIAASMQLVAEEVSFQSTAPRNVVEGAQFQLQYILKGGRGEGLNVSEDIDGFDLLYGPTTSTIQSSSSINGVTSFESIITYTYLLKANKAGTFNMPAADIKVNGKNYRSNVVRVKVLPPDKNAEPTEPGRQPQTIVQKSKGTVATDDAFIRAIFSKTKIHEQEAVVATFRFYTVLQIVDVGKIQFPEFENFMTEDFPLSANRQWEMEHFNGRNYMVLDVKKTLLFPQHSGEITIPTGTMDIVFEVNSGKTLNHPLFGPQEITTEARKQLTTSPVKLNVVALPDGKPLGFSGGVGVFDISSDLSSTNVKANDAVTFKIKIKGHGNMKLVRDPVLDLDKSFEIYDPKVDNKFVVAASGLVGEKNLEYLFVPRYPGEFTIPAIEFLYFDTNSRSYKTLKTEEYKLNVAVDPNAKERTQATSYNQQSEVQVEQDIRYLKLGKFGYTKTSNLIINSNLYPLWYIIPSLLFAIILFVYRKQIKANADIARMKTKRANKVATRRLRLAKKYLNENNKDGYYEEVLRAVWGYLSDKLTISITGLNRENVENELLRYGAAQKLVDEYIEIIDTCEFARYAPSQANDAMGNLYQETVDAIGKMESTIKIK